jgi:Xaa-Pro aminopeptidase
LEDFDKVLKEVMAQVDHVYLLTHEHIRRSSEVETREERFGKSLRTRFPNHSYRRSAPALNALRAVKSAEEIAVMQVAADITTKGFDRVLRFLKPGVMEFGP